MKHATERGTGSPSPALQKILVTGGTGYLAANLIDLLKNTDCHIVRLGRPATVFTPMAGVARIEDVRGDIRQRTTWERSLVRKCYGVTPDKIRVISAPVDTELFHPREARTVVAPHCQNPFRILTAGTLTRQKGFDFVLEAFAELNRRSPKCDRLTVA